MQVCLITAFNGLFHWFVYLLRSLIVHTFIL